jgi:hypothetical protein
MSKNPRQQTTTRVLVTVEVTDLQPWGPECTTAQIYKRSREAALLSVDCAIRGQQQPDRSGSLRVVGTPQIMMVITEDEKL